MLFVQIFNFSYFFDYGNVSSGQRKHSISINQYLIKFIIVEVRNKITFDDLLLKT